MTRAVGDRTMERLLAQGVREREPDEDETGEADDTAADEGPTRSPAIRTFAAARRPGPPRTGG